MTLIDLLGRLETLGVSLWADGDRLRLRAPVGVVTPELREALEAHKPALLAQLQASAGPDRLPPLVAAAPTERPALSFAQQRLWFLAQLDPESAAYNIPAAIRITGALDAAVVARAANEIVQRHAVLRTTFHQEDGEPVLRVHERLPIEVPLVDLRALDEQGRAARVAELAAAQTRGLFDLARGPLLRLSLLRLSQEEHVLLFTIHHLASDGWSSRVFMRELAALYDAFAHGRPSPLPPLALQYTDFAAWQRGWLSGALLERQRAYWRERLERLPVVELPTDRPRPPIQTFDGASVQFTVPASLAGALKAMAKQEGVTLFQLLLSAFGALVFHVTGAHDVPIGSPVVNRGTREVEGLIGFFVNALVIRIDLSGRPAFRELLRRVRQVTLEAYAHQDVPFEQLVAELQPQRDLSRHALFQTVFVLQDNPVERQEMHGLTLRQMDVDSWHVKFDLIVNAWESQGELVVWWEYNTALFDRETIASLFERYVRILEAIVAAPDTSIDDLEILSAEEIALLSQTPRIPPLALEFTR